MRYISLLAVLIMGGVAHAFPAGPTAREEDYSYAITDNSTSVDPYPSSYGTKHLVKRGHVICQTGGNSPLIEHVDVGIEQLDYEGGDCKQDNNEGRCNMVMKGGDAEMIICGPFPQKLPCKEIARAIKEVRNRCEKDGRAAGEWDFLGTGLKARLAESEYQLAPDNMRQSDYL